VKNIVWHSGEIDRSKREHLLGQKSKLIWFTGLSGSGKSTVANAVEEELHKMGKLTYLLDGDNLRFGLNGDLGFSIEDRSENIRRIAEVGKLFLDSGAITLCTFVSPTRDMRNLVRETVGDDFIEVYVKCGIETCKERDPKGLYKKAMAGEISDFTGIDSPYEEPESPELVLETDRQSVEELSRAVIDYLKFKEVI
jgi:adenylylsulfate kinase